MNKMISQKTLFLALFAPCFSIWGTIIEIKHFSQAIDFISPDSLVLLDIDNTVLEPTHENQQGSDQWFSTLLGQHPTPEQAIAQYCSAVLTCPMQLVEPDIPAILNTIQQRAQLLGFTMRSMVLAPCTTYYLKEFGIDLGSHIPDQGFMIDGIHPVLLYHNIIFCQGQKHGSTLLHILDALALQPTTIVMIDDKIRYLKLIEHACQQRGINFIGLRYGFLDKKVQKFLDAQNLTNPQ